MLNRLWSLFLISTSLILLSSCSKSPDVRLSLCQDVTQELLSASGQLQWQAHKAIIKGYQDMEMALQFTTENEPDTSLQAACYYPYEEDEIGAETFETPTSAFATYPSKMRLNGQRVDTVLLAKTINIVMVKQGKAIIKHAVDKVEHASQTAIDKIKAEPSVK